MASTSKLDAIHSLERRINKFIQIKDIDWWSPFNKSDTEDTYRRSLTDCLDERKYAYGAFLSFIGYHKEDFSQGWAEYCTKKVCVGYRKELKGFSGQVDERGNIDVTPDYDSIPEYEEQNVLRRSGEVSDSLYCVFGRQYAKCRELRKEFQDKWLDFYTKNKINTCPDGFYLNVKTNTLDRAKFKFIKAEDTKSQIKKAENANLPFLLFSLAMIILTPLSFFYSLRGFQFSDLNNIISLFVFKDSFIHLKPDFNYVLFYSLFAVSFALCLANCIYFGKKSRWILLVLFLIFTFIFPFGATAVFFIATRGKNTAFDFFAFLLTCSQFVLEIPIFLCLLIYRLGIKKRISANADARNKETADLLKFFTEFQAKGALYSFSEYLRKWTEITGRKYFLGSQCKSSIVKKG